MRLLVWSVLLKDTAKNTIEQKFVQLNCRKFRYYYLILGELECFLIKKNVFFKTNLKIKEVLFFIK